MTDALSDEKLRGTLRVALANLVRLVEPMLCHHETTHRGGAIWTICDDCGTKWADDRGGFQPYEEPPALTAAYAALRSAPPVVAKQLAGLEAALSEARKQVIEECARVAQYGIDRVTRDFHGSDQQAAARMATEILDAIRALSKQEPGT